MHRLVAAAWVVEVIIRHSADTNIGPAKTSRTCGSDPVAWSSTVSFTDFLQAILNSPMFVAKPDLQQCLQNPKYSLLLTFLCN